MYNIGICDDGKNICASLEEMVLQYAEKSKRKMDIQVWYTGEELCRYLEQGGHLDILFLDIELMKLSGGRKVNIHIGFGIVCFIISFSSEKPSHISYFVP